MQYSSHRGSLPVVDEVFPACLAPMGLFAVVDAHVVVEVFARHEPLTTHVTDVRLVAPVDHHVLVPQRCRSERLVTHTAFERLLSLMYPVKHED